MILFLSSLLLSSDRRRGVLWGERENRNKDRDHSNHLGMTYKMETSLERGKKLGKLYRMIFYLKTRSLLNLLQIFSYYPPLSRFKCIRARKKQKIKKKFRSATAMSRITLRICATAWTGPNSWTSSSECSSSIRTSVCSPTRDLSTNSSQWLTSPATVTPTSKCFS